MAEVSDSEIELCERICRLASNKGFGLKELDTQWGHSFVWRYPNGETLSGEIWKDQKRALLSAVQVILPTIFTHV